MGGQASYPVVLLQFFVKAFPVNGRDNYPLAAGTGLGIKTLGQEVIGEIAASIERTARSAEEAARASAETSAPATGPPKK